MILEVFGWACLAFPLWVTMIFVVGIYERIGDDNGNRGERKNGNPFGRN